jgi:Cu2+-exporting ATPase
VELREIQQGHSPEAVFRIAAALESASGHPIALAFPPANPASAIEALKEFPGAGVEGRVDGTLWRLGTFPFVKELVASADRGLPDDADAGIFLASAEGIAATFSLKDVLRPDTVRAIERLRDMGLEVAIASGDRQAVVDSVARQLSIQDARGRLTPQQKLALVRQRQSGGTHVLMVGDGINDGPVLAAASISCAMAQGSAIAQAAADLLLLNGSLSTLAQAIGTARQMRAVIRQNLAWALVYNFAAVPLAALGWIAPWVAAIGMSASSLLVVLNAARLARSGGTTP